VAKVVIDEHIIEDGAKPLARLPRAGKGQRLNTLQLPAVDLRGTSCI
jgi:hypothetical protein